MDNIFYQVNEGFSNILIAFFIRNVFLLNTIRIPKNISYLTERLPKPNYFPL